MQVCFFQHIRLGVVMSTLEEHLSLETSPITGKLDFITRRTGEDEVILLGQALCLGLDLLYRQTVERAFIKEAILRERAIAVLGLERVEEIEYAKQALAQDIARGLSYDPGSVR
jgi:hypothetical protein